MTSYQQLSNKIHHVLHFGLGLFICIAVFSVWFLPQSGSSAQSRSFVWDRWDMVIDNIDTSANQFQVTEIYDMLFSGRFTFGVALIPLDRVENITITNITINGQALRPNCTEAPGTFCPQTVAEGLSLTYYFPQAVVDESVSIRITYSVVGGLRVYDDYHVLNWYAVAPEHAAPVSRSTVVVNMPSNVQVRPDVDTVVSPDVEAQIVVCDDFASCPIELAPYIDSIEGQAVGLQAKDTLATNEAFEFIITYSPDPAMAKPPWQDAFDAQRAFEQGMQPILNLASLVIAGLFGVGGPLFIFSRYYQSGRDPDIGVVPEYITEPPSDLSPAAVGTLLDETADVSDVLSALIDLANRGYLVIEESKSDGIFGIGAKSSFTFKRTNKSQADLTSFESRLMTSVFDRALVKELDDLKNKFYAKLPSLKDALYQELVSEGYFPRSPESTRNRYQGVGTFLGVGALIVFFIALEQIESGMTFLLPPLIAIGFTGLFLIIIAGAMPVKTQKGAQQAALWKAFRQYLENVKRYSDLDTASENFNRYLPYAIVFGLEKHWVNTFRVVNRTDMFPTWYYPRHLGGYWGDGFNAGGRPLSHADMIPGDLVGQTGGFSLDSASSSMSEGLNSLSSGLSDMLSSASSAMSSSPSSSGGGGGGFSGGGGGGGGSRGFG